MKKAFVLSYSVICYIIGLAAVAYYADFFMGLFITKTINSGDTIPVLLAIAINLVLLLLFAIQHSVMARPAVKEAMRKYVPFAMERSTYILLSSVVLLVVCIFWQPIPQAVFDFRGTPAEPIFWAMYALGWFFTLFSTFLIDHFDLFGLKQAYYYGKKKTFAYKFVTPVLYKLVRHPIYLGWFMIHWFNPYLSAGQLMMALVFTVYIYVAISYEEKDLVDAFGDEYRQYQKSTPKLLPGLGYGRKKSKA